MPARVGGGNHPAALPTDQPANMQVAAAARRRQVVDQADIADGCPFCHAKQADIVRAATQHGQVADGMSVAVKDGGKGVADTVAAVVFVVADGLPAVIV